MAELPHATSEGTPFQHFWDRLDERPDITCRSTRWAADRPLAHRGRSRPASGAATRSCCCMRGTLLRRYPDW